MNLIDKSYRYQSLLAVFCSSRADETNGAGDIGLNNGGPIMRSTQQFSITLPNDMAAAVADKISSGAYASVSEFMRDGIRALMERDAAIDKWLREEVIPRPPGISGRSV
ncbi:MAG: type II toxin-antitoxin system ParD family antitoxin [Asticcacaulis sp.]|uniref:ribbon-helix-helix domain-containing protein n=1 Tax=Asticcacaulis sp. TaxID=1872648 RepID=UPI0039E4FBE7